MRKAIPPLPHAVTLNSEESQLYLSFSYPSLSAIRETKNKFLAKNRLVYYFNWTTTFHICSLNVID